MGEEPAPIRPVQSNPGVAVPVDPAATLATSGIRTCTHRTSPNPENPHHNGPLHVVVAKRDDSGYHPATVRTSAPHGPRAAAMPDDSHQGIPLCVYQAALPGRCVVLRPLLLNCPATNPSQGGEG